MEYHDACNAVSTSSDNNTMLNILFMSDISLLANENLYFNVNATEKTMCATEKGQVSAMLHQLAVIITQCA